MPRKVLRSPRHARKDKKKKNVKLLLLFLVALSVLGGAVYAFSRPQFRIKDVEITGMSRIPEEAIQSLVQGKLTGTYLGFIPRAHTLLYPKKELKGALTSAFPTFAAVSVSLKNLGALHVLVREREPKVLWCTAKKECFLMDETGFVFAPAEPGIERLFYQLETMATTTSIGSVALPRERLAALLTFLKRLEDMKLETVKVRFQEEGDMELLLSSGTHLLLREGEYDWAVAGLEALLTERGLLPKQSGSLGVSYIDLRYGNKIYFKPN